jgi:hypothetical protein
MYVAYYGRPGDPGGIAFWAEKLDDAGGDLDEIVDAFGTSREFTDNYGDLSPTQLVTTLFQQILGREPDPVGLSFYRNLLETGARSLASIALDIANGVINEDVDTLTNRIEAASFFSDTIEVSGAPYGNDQLAFARSVISAVDGDAATVASARMEIEDYVSSVEAGDTVFGSIVSAATASINANTLGSIDFGGDEDWFLVELDDDVLYTFELQGYDSGSGTLFDPLLTLFNAQGDEVGGNDDGGIGFESRVVFEPPSGGPYFLAVRSFDEQDVGSFLLSVSSRDAAIAQDVRQLIDATDFEDLFFEDFFDARWTLDESGTAILSWSPVADFIELPSGAIEPVSRSFLNDELAILQQAFGGWSEASGGRILFDLTVPGNNADIAVGLTSIDGQGGTQALWNYSYFSDTGEITAATIRFDIADVGVDLLQAALQEIGNVLGLGDINPDTTLQSALEDPFPLVPENQLLPLSIFDQAALAWNYDLFG